MAINLQKILWLSSAVLSSGCFYNLGAIAAEEPTYKTASLNVNFQNPKITKSLTFDQQEFLSQVKTKYPPDTTSNTLNFENSTVAENLTEEENQPLQITSVSEFSDVQPTDWAFQALQSLVEKYGCIAGNSQSASTSRTFRGNQALTRYEFAAGLSACLERINQLIASGTSDSVNKEDLLALQQLQKQFATELVTLRGRVDTLEVRTRTLEQQQFS